MTKVITIGNFKGGVGKSTLTELLSYLLSVQEEKKVLVIDADPQQNLTEKIRKTFNNDELPKSTMMKAIEDFELNNAIIKVHDNLDMVVGDNEIGLFHEFVIKNYDEKAKYYLLYSLLQEIKDNYDYILIDTRPSDPSVDILTTNVICASDYVLITAKTEQDSYTSTSKYYTSLGEIAAYNENLKFLGIVPYLVNERSSTDKEILNKFKVLFEEDMFNHVVKNSDRVKTWGRTGVTTDKPHDKNTLKMYQELLKELLERIEIKEN